jgi:hypothetical protein
MQCLPVVTRRLSHILRHTVVVSPFVRRFGSVASSDSLVPPVVDDAKAKARAVVRLRSLLFSASKKQQGDYIPKALIQQACDEYERLDRPARHQTLQSLATELGVDLHSDMARTQFTTALVRGGWEACTASWY